MIEKSTLQFLSDLKKNNVKEWFDNHRKNYDAAKENAQKVFEQFIKAIGAFDENIAVLPLKDCTYRINRDIRFSKDKTPYKTNMAGYFAKGGKKSDASGYYVHIEPGAAFIGAGCWWPHAKLLSAVRQEIDYNADEWKKIITDKTFSKTFPGGISKTDMLQRPPKGYDENNPAITFIKMKSFTVTTPISDEEMLSKDFVKNTAAKLIAVKPMIDFLNRAEADV